MRTSRWRGSRLRAAATAAALLIAFVPQNSARATAKAVSVPAFASPAGAVRFDRTAGVVRAPRTLLEAVRGAVVARDPSAFPAALRASLRLQWPEAAPAEAAGPLGTLRFGLPAGDLTGDGKGDVLDVEVDVLTFHAVSITARRGTDARSLWSLRFPPTADAVPIAVGDVTGDRAGDVLVARFDPGEGAGTGSCLVVDCFEAGTVPYHWTFSMVSGPSGRQVWSRTYDGEEIFADSSIAGAISATNGIVVPFVSGDHDHDGHPDVVFDALDVTAVPAGVAAGSDAVNAGVEESSVLIATHASVVSGASGAEIWSRDQGPTPGGAALLPSGNATGNTTPDLLWENESKVASPVVCGDGAVGSVCAGVERGGVDGEMIDGSTMRTAWTASFAGRSAFLVPADGDPTGDGHADVFLYETGDDGVFRVGVVSGATGKGLWTSPVDPDGSVGVVGSLHGRRGDDVITGSYVLVSDQPLRVALRLDRLDGRTGMTLLRTDHVFADTRTKGIAAIEFYLLGDGDHDRVADVGVSALYRDSERNDLYSTGYVESGRTGRALWSRRTTGFAVTQPAGDATGDGSADVIDFVLNEDDMVLSVVDLTPVHRVWTRADPLPDGFLSVVSADESGRGGDDQILSRLRITWRGVVSRIDGVDGGTGRLIWGTGQALPSRPRGKIAGSVREPNGKALAGVCAVAYDRHDLPIAGGASIADGTYHVGRLPDGRYKVRFADCSSQTHQVRWYKHKRDPSSADVIVVRGGRKTSGIDEVLPRA